MDFGGGNRPGLTFPSGIRHAWKRFQRLDGNGLDRAVEGKLDDVLRAERGNEGPRRSQGDQAPAIHDADTIAERLRFVHVVCRQEDAAAFPAKTLEDLPELPARLGIET